MKTRTLTQLSALLAFTSLPLFGCTDPPVNTDALGANQPAGVIQGSILYSGPPPCTENGKIIGAAEIMLFDVNMLPPPEGLGTSAANLDVIPGEVLFKSIAPSLKYNADGSRYCAPEDEVVTVSAPFSIAPLAAGRYQLRGFYDRDNDFQPVFKIRNLPTAGDIGGGAIDNAAQVLAGAAPKYTVFEIGVRNKKTGKLEIPEDGFLFQGASVSFAVNIKTNRPYFHFKSAKIESAWSENEAEKGKPKELDAHNLQMPSDFRLNVFSSTDPMETDKSLLKLVVGAGPADDELKAAMNKPFLMHVSSDPAKNMLLFMGSDSNFDGKICYSNCGDAKPDTIPDSDLIPALDPLAIFAKLDDNDPTLQKSQTAPVVIIQNITLYDGGLIGTLGGPGAIENNGGFAPSNDITLAVRPVAICIPHPEDPNSTAIAVTPWKLDGAGNKIIEDPDAVKAGISTSLHRPVEIRYGCLPEGKYALNLIYSATGQAWTVPNEAGVCSPTEPKRMVNGQPWCDAGPGGHRRLLPSQGEYLTITKPETNRCQEMPVPAECLPPKH